MVSNSEVAPPWPIPQHQLLPANAFRETVATKGPDQAVPSEECAKTYQNWFRSARSLANTSAHEPGSILHQPFISEGWLSGPPQVSGLKNAIDVQIGDG